MLIGLGFLMIAVFMYLILSKRLTPVVALILVPVVFGIAAVQFGAAVAAGGRRGHRLDHGRDQEFRADRGVAVLRDHLLRVDDRRRACSTR